MQKLRKDWPKVKHFDMHLNGIISIDWGAKCGDKEHQEDDEEEAQLQQRQQQGSTTRKAIKKRAIERQTKAQSGIVVRSL